MPETKCSTSHCKPPKSLPLFSLLHLFFIPLFLEGPKLECIFNAGMHFPAVEICRRLVTEAQQPGPYSQPARRCFACMHALSCKYKERAVAEFPTASFKSEVVLTQRCWVLGYWGVRAKFSGVQQENSTNKSFFWYGDICNSLSLLVSIKYRAYAAASSTVGLLINKIAFFCL